MVSMVIVIIYKYADTVLELQWAVIMLKQNAIFHGTVVPLNLPLSHWMIRLATGMANPFFLKIVTQIF